MIYIFDIDGTLADIKIDGNKFYGIENVMPDENMIRAVNVLYDKGHTIVIMTGRGSTTGIDWREETEKQLKDWGVKYTELRFVKKPEEYLYVDDKACSPEEFWHKADL